MHGYYSRVYRVYRVLVPCDWRSSRYRRYHDPDVRAAGARCRAVQCECHWPVEWRGSRRGVCDLVRFAFWCASGKEMVQLPRGGIRPHTISHGKFIYSVCVKSIHLTCLDRS